MSVYCGVDFHARKQTICYLTTEDGELKQIELPHEHPEQRVVVRAFFTDLCLLGHVIVGFESSGYAAWFEEMLEALGCEIWLGHAAEIRRCAHRRQKNDRPRRCSDPRVDGARRVSPHPPPLAGKPCSLTTTALSAAPGQDAHHAHQQLAVHGCQSRLDPAWQIADKAR